VRRQRPLCTVAVPYWYLPQLVFRSKFSFGPGALYPYRSPEREAFMLGRLPGFVVTMAWLLFATLLYLLLIQVAISDVMSVLR
jgi:hypothetical protein